GSELQRGGERPREPWYDQLDRTHARTLPGEDNGSTAFSFTDSQAYRTTARGDARATRCRQGNHQVVALQFLSALRSNDQAHHTTAPAFAKATARQARGRSPHRRGTGAALQRDETRHALVVGQAGCVTCFAREGDGGGEVAADFIGGVGI